MKRVNVMGSALRVLLLPLAFTLCCIIELGGLAKWGFDKLNRLIPWWFRDETETGHG